MPRKRGECNLRHDSGPSRTGDPLGSRSVHPAGAAAEEADDAGPCNLIHRAQRQVGVYLTPNEDNEAQCAKMKDMGIFTSVKEEIGQLIVATVGRERAPGTGHIGQREGKLIGSA